MLKIFQFVRAFIATVAGFRNNADTELKIVPRSKFPSIIS
jgi:hypothetical protein